MYRWCLIVFGPNQWKPGVHSVPAPLASIVQSIGESNTEAEARTLFNQSRPTLEQGVYCLIHPDGQWIDMEVLS